MALVAVAPIRSGLAGEPAGAPAAAGQPPVSYHVAGRFEVGGAEAGYDYLKVDGASRRLFVAHGTRVEVLDADSGARLGALTNLAGAHGIEVVERVHRAFATSGKDRAVVMFDPATLAVAKVIRYLGEKPDALEYDPASGMLFVVNGGATGDVSVIDPASGAIVGTIELGGGKLEEIGFDGKGRGFVNDEDKSVVHVFDTRTLKPVARWALAPAEGPTGLVVDAEHHRLFAACGNKLLAVVDTMSGKVTATAPIGVDPDGAAYDRARGRIFTSNHDGTLSVVGEDAAGHFVLLQTVQTGPGARTIARDEKTGRLYLPTAAFGPAPAPTPEVPEPRAPLLPGSFAILVVAP